MFTISFCRYSTEKEWREDAESVHALGPRDFVFHGGRQRRYRAGMLQLDKVTRAEFAACMNTPFELITDTQCFVLTLIETRNLGTARPGAPRKPFALKFRGTPEVRLPQQTYRLHHAQMGVMEIFLVQIGADLNGSHFEAVFN
jgi:hypothetical protein